jgi:hypothetical protein
MASDDPLKLAALDAEDLQVISAHLQDAVLTLADMVYSPGARRFSMVLNRFDWEHGAKAGRGPYRRRQCGLSLDRVTAVRSLGLRKRRSDTALELLAVDFTPGEAPSGTIGLIFAGGPTVHLEVECIEARLSDLGPQWTTRRRPKHEPGEAAGGARR